MNLEIRPNATKLAELLVPETEETWKQVYESLPARAAEQVYGIEPEVVMLDIESTGFFDGTNRITEIGMIRMQGARIIERYSQLINPGMPIPPEISKLTGISDEMVADAPSILEASNAIRSFLGDRDIVAHNANFDKRFIDAELGFISNNWIDSIRLLRVGLPRLRAYGLSGIAAWLGLDSPHAHRALADCEMLAGAWRLALAGLSSVPAEVLAALLNLNFEGELDEKIWIERVLTSTGLKPKALSLKTLRQSYIKEESRDPKLDANELNLKFTNKEKLLKYFHTLISLDGAFERRSSQEEMSEAVYEAFEGGQTLIAEAPTGVGKSLAYLLPAVLMAQENDITIGIATKTNALADQLQSSEIPQLKARLAQAGYPEADFTYAPVKGYENYFCLRKIDRLIRSKGLSPTNLDHVISWVAQTPANDLSRYSGPPMRRSEMVATQAECSKRRCPFFPRLCYIHGARARAKVADIVITNHSLLVRDAVSAIKVLPPIRFWIVDEAHSFEKETRRQTEIRISGFELASEIENLLMPNSGILARIEKQGSKDGAALSTTSELGLLVKDFGAHARESLSELSNFNSFSFETYAKKVKGAEYAESEVWIDEQLRESENFRILKTLMQALTDVLVDLQRSGAKVCDAMNVEDKTLTNPDLLQEARIFVESVGSFLAAAELIFFEPESDYYYTIYPDAFRKTVSYAAAPLEVGPIINRSLLPQTHSIIFTSATLSVAQSFEVLKARIGLDSLDEDSLRELILPEAYNLAEQMRIFVSSDMPEPNSKEYLPELGRFLTELHRATGGGVLSLFTNRREMSYAYKFVTAALKAESHEILLQSSGARNFMNSLRFVEERDSSLFAVKSFWEGFDAKGHTLRCVAIPKIPFAQPGTSIARERNLRYGAAAWRNYDLPDAILELKQAIGRLIRSSSDRGHVVLGDSRIISKGYGKSILRSLPVAAEICTQAEIVSAVQADYAAGTFADDED